MNAIRKTWAFKVGKWPVGQLGIAGLVFFVLAMGSRSPRTEGEKGGFDIEAMIEQAYGMGRKDQSEFEEGVEEGASEVVGRVFGDSVESALLAEWTELEQLTESSILAVQDSVECRAIRFYEHAMSLAGEQGISATFWLDSELNKRRQQLMELHDRYGDLNMASQQFNEAMPVIADYNAITMAIRRSKAGWVEKDAQGNEIPTPDLFCRVQIASLSRETGEYLFQVSAREDVERQQRQTGDRLIESTQDDEVSVNEE